MSKWFELISERMKLEGLGFDFYYLDIGDLLPVAILCGISILFTVLWLLAVLEYLWLRDRKQCRTEDHR